MVLDLWPSNIHIDCDFAISDPSPVELITKFLTKSTDISSGKDTTPEPDTRADEKLNPCRRSRGLKILSLKIAAFLKWDLDVLEQK